MPTLDETFEQYMAANPNRSKRTNELYRYEANRYLGDWLPRPLDAISRADVEARFNSITADHGWSAANRAMSLLRSIYRRPCVDHDGLRNPVDLWLAGGGKFHRKARRKISAPAEVLPCWRAGIEAEVNNPAIRDALWFGLYTGMRRDEVLTLRWERVDMDALTFRVEETKTGVPLELPITNQLTAILERRQTATAGLPEGVREWVFPSPTSATGHVQDPHHLYARIGKAGGAKFWFHGLRNSFITVAERELMLPPSLTKRLVNHARPNDVTQGYRRVRHNDCTAAHDPQAGRSHDPCAEEHRDRATGAGRLFCLWIQHVDHPAARTNAELRADRHRYLAGPCASFP
ncbi:MAG: tyrosine-type recombinase/integrase [Rhodospirillaceae bacterium]|nr:tyrosine-type recombinase/integrase [Rhodospirillaceae bacterium]